jgi:hypothetical protein
MALFSRNSFSEAQILDALRTVPRARIGWGFGITQNDPKLILNTIVY